MRTFKEAMIAKKNIQELKKLVEFIAENGGNVEAFLDALTSSGLLNEARPAPSQPGIIQQGAGGIGRAIGSSVGGALGIIGGAVGNVASTAASAVGGAASGLASGAAQRYTQLTQGSTLVPHVNNALTAIQELEKRIKTSGPLRKELGTTEFTQLLANLKDAIQNKLVENNYYKKNIIKEKYDDKNLKDVLIKLSEAGYDPETFVNIYLENKNGVYNEIFGLFQGIYNWFQNARNNAQAAADKKSLENAVKAIKDLNAAIPNYKETPSQEFQQFSQQFLQSIDKLEGGGEAKRQETTNANKLKEKLKATLPEPDKTKIDALDPNIFTSVVLKGQIDHDAKITNDAKKNAWIQTIATAIAQNPDPKNIQNIVNGTNSIEFFFADLESKNPTLASEAKTQFDAINDANAKYLLASRLLKYAVDYAKAVENDNAKITNWYNIIGTEIKDGKPPLEVVKKAEQLVRTEGPATTKASKYFTDSPAKAGAKYNKIPPEQRNDFEQRFQQIYNAIGDNEKTGKLIMQQTIKNFAPDPTQKNADLFQKAFQTALDAKIRELYDTGEDNNYSNEMSSTSYQDQVKLLQKCNKFLKTNPSDTDIKNWWTEIGVAKRGGEDILESRKQNKSDKMFIESILGRTKNPKAGWFNF